MVGESVEEFEPAPQWLLDDLQYTQEDWDRVQVEERNVFIRFLRRFRGGL